MSNSQLKEISFQPILTNMKNKGSPKNRTVKKYSSSQIKPNKLKTQLLTKIKNYRQNNSVNNKDNTDTINTNDTNDTPKFSIIKKDTNNISQEESHKTFFQATKINKPNRCVLKNSLSSSLEDDDDFTQSINFLKDLSSKNNKKTLKNSDNFPIHLGNSDMNINSNKLNDPSYGCLKNGSLPTYREWKNKTIKNTFNNGSNNDINENNNSIINNISYAENLIEKNLETNREKYRSISSNPKKTTTLKYYLGKKGKKISILIKNSATRKKVNDEHMLLKQTKITDMKNYLKRHNLLKSGSHAPPEIIKKLYEQALLGGNIRNSNKNNIIHNYLS